MTRVRNFMWQPFHFIQTRLLLTISPRLLVPLHVRFSRYFLDFCLCMCLHTQIPRRPRVLELEKWRSVRMDEVKNFTTQKTIGLASLFLQNNAITGKRAFCGIAQSALQLCILCHRTALYLVDTCIDMQ